MLIAGVAKRYAEALFELARDKDQVESISAEIRRVQEVITAVPEFTAYLDNFLINGAEKKETVGLVFEGQLSPLVSDFISLLVDKRRESYLGLILTAFIVLVDEAAGIKDTDLYTATALSPEAVKSLTEKLSQATGYTIRLHASVDPQLIAGVKLRIGDRIVDGTLRKQLEMLGDKMKYA
jgi:F-type H+-transporting ATPase subunit delta